MNARTYGKAFALASIGGALLLAAACGSDTAPTDVGSTGGATSTGGTSSTGGRPTTGTGGTNQAGAGGGSAGAGGSNKDGGGGAGGTSDAGNDVSAGGSTSTGGTDSGAPSDCFTNPTTHFEIINACTNAQKVDKNPVLPLNLPDGGLKPLP